MSKATRWLILALGITVTWVAFSVLGRALILPLLLGVGATVIWKIRSSAVGYFPAHAGSKLSTRPIRPATPRALQIGPYNVVSTLGKGGMGTVFKALGPQGQTVAIKVIGGLGTARNAKADELYRMGLVREARLAAELRHPNIVKIFDIGQVNGNLFVVMEYLEGAPLNLHVANHQLSVPKALLIAAELCDALGYAHDRGIIHRDVKPQNTFVLNNGTVKLLDFGLARQSDTMERPGLVGTPPYMSPEQILGKDLDGRTDIWSVGVTLFEMLAGTPPFGRNQLGLYNRILGVPAPRLKLPPPYTSEFDVILSKALAKDRDARYSSAGHFGEDLKSLLRRTQEAPTVDKTLAQPTGLSSLGVGRAGVRDPAPQLYTPVNLGFTEQVKGPVFFPVVREKRGFLHRIWREIPSLARAIVSQLAWTVLVGGIGFVIFAILLVLGILFAMVVIAPLAIYEGAFPPPFFRCRSCQRRMRPVSAWVRPTWIADKYGFCVPDCVAALQNGLWEEAVKLLCVHTTETDDERRFKLEFFECPKCRDQRAYFAVETKVGGTWEVNWVREAYTLRDPVNRQRFVNSLTLGDRAKPMASPKGSGDTDAQITL